jgi:DNA polymerase III alpha subunit
MGMIKNIKRGKGWTRVELLDKTGSVGIFDSENTTIEVGKTYIILASDNRVMSAIPADNAKDMENALIKFLNYKSLPYKDDEMYVVSFRPRDTKTGKKMAYLTLADVSRDLHSVVVFPTVFPKAFMKVKEGNAYRFDLSKSKDGTLLVDDIKEVNV